MANYIVNEDDSADRHVDISSCINIWCQCKYVKSSFTFHNEKWFKIPDDYTSRLKLKHLKGKYGMNTFRTLNFIMVLTTLTRYKNFQKKIFC